MRKITTFDGEPLEYIELWLPRSNPPQSRDRLIIIKRGGQ